MFYRVVLLFAGGRIVIGSVAVIIGLFTVLVVGVPGERFALRSWNMVPENGQQRRGAYYYARSTDTGKKLRYHGDVVVFWKHGNRLSVMSA